MPNEVFRIFETYRIQNAGFATWYSEILWIPLWISKTGSITNEAYSFDVKFLTLVEQALRMFQVEISFQGDSLDVKFNSVTHSIIEIEC